MLKQYRFLQVRKVSEGITRRVFLHASLGGMTGLAEVLALHTPPSFAQSRRLGILLPSHFIPQADQALQAIGKRFEKATKVEVEFTQLRSIVGVLERKEEEGKFLNVYDLLMLSGDLLWLQSTNLVTVSDVVEGLTKRYGPLYDFCREAAFSKHHWVAMPAYHVPYLASYNKKYFEEVGEKPPQTWTDLGHAGKNLKAKGHPVGIPISSTNDALAVLNPIMWAYGAKVVEANGKTVSINSPETGAAIEYIKRLASEAMKGGVLAWDDTSNNRFLLSGEGSWIANSLGHYLVAKKENMPVAEDIYFQPMPAGPKGRYTTTIVQSLAISKFSKNINLAKEFIQFFFTQENYNSYVNAAQGLNAPVFRSPEDHPVWKTDPKYEPIKASAGYAHMFGWPAPGDEKNRLVQINSVIPKMFAKAVTEASTKDAMQWAEAMIKRIYAK
jgi:multiple sugar transport system substrate-binding protein